MYTVTISIASEGARKVVSENQFNTEVEARNAAQESWDELTIIDEVQEPHTIIISAEDGEIVDEQVAYAGEPE